MAKETPTSDKARRREEARQKALELQQEQLKREQRSRIVVLSAILLGVVLLGGLIYFILSKAPSDLAGITELPEDVAVPTATEDNKSVTFTKDGAIVFAKPGVDEATTPVLDVYLDFMCNACASFEQVNAADIQAAVDNGDIIYRAHPVTILGFQHSQRIGSTFAALAQSSPDHALAFAAEAFAQQSQAGLTSDQMQQIAIGVGVDKDVAKAATDGKFERFIVGASEITLGNEDLRNENGRFATPSVFINGERSDVNWSQPGLLMEALDQAAQ